MKLEDLWNLTKDGKFFGVKFVKRTTGEVRRMNARVRPPAEGGPGMPYDPSQHNLLVVWDVHKKAWRQIPADNVLELRAHGLRIG